MFSSRKTTNASVALAYDPQFNYVTTLLHGDGTNGAQNNTFVDSSTNAFSLTKQGTPTQGSFTPYGTLWSNYFNGSTDYLTLGGQSSFAFGTSAFTIEFWVYSTSYSTQINLYDSRPASTNGYYPSIYSGSDGSLNFYVNNANVISSSASALIANTWCHIAVSKSGSNTKMFLNGTQVGSTYSDTNTYVNGASAPVIGGQGVSRGSYLLNGYISNLRVVNGTGVYTSNFIVPTTPLTAITNTQLLTCQSNRFIDNSTNNFTITTSGAPSVQRFNPFLPTSSQAYSTSVYGGSGYLNGSSDYLTASSNSAFAFGSGAFTVEFWIYPTATFPAFASPFTTGSTTNDFVIDVQTSGLSIDVNNNAVVIATSSIALTANAWNHVAVTRGSSGSTLYIFINGQQGANVTNSTSWTNTGNLTIGKQSNIYVPGYITDLRVVKGTQVYSSAFTPPTVPLTAITNTSLLLSMQNAGIYDNAMMPDWITLGSAQISTSVKKYGTGSLSFNGSTDYLQTPSSPVITLNGNFTIECWVYFNNVSSAQPIISYGTSGSASNLLFLFNTSVGLRWYFSSGTVDINQGSASGWSASTWYHVAAVRSGSTLTLYRNGTSIASGTTTQVYEAGALLNVGASPGDSVFLNGYIDDFRITNGYARYTSNFTPPTSAFPNY